MILPTEGEGRGVSSSSRSVIGGLKDKAGPSVRVVVVSKERLSFSSRERQGERPIVWNGGSDGVCLKGRRIVGEGVAFLLSSFKAFFLFSFFFFLFSFFFFLFSFFFFLFSFFFFLFSFFFFAFTFFLPSFYFFLSKKDSPEKTNAAKVPLVFFRQHQQKTRQDIKR